MYHEKVDLGVSKSYEKWDTNDTPFNQLRHIRSWSSIYNLGLSSYYSVTF